MKATLILLSICAALMAGAAEPEDKDASAILAAMPSVTSIVKTSYGYRVETEQGTRFVNRASYGYRIPGDRGTVFLNRTRYGFRVESSH